jgi:replicative DNA helicase
MSISNKELERQFLSGLLQYPKVWNELCSIINKDDFLSDVHRTIFLVMKTFLDKNDAIDEIVITERIKNLNMSFMDDIDIADYILNLKNLSITDEKQIYSVAKELKTYSIRRQIEQTGQKLQTLAKQSNSISIDEILVKSDKVYNENINTLISSNNSPQNIFEDMEEVIEERGNNPIEEFGLPGPYKRVNDLYGSLLRPGNIAAIVARSSVGKTNLAMDFTLKTSAATGVPVLHFDNGEMSKKELQFRQCAALSGVPAYLIETGKWRLDPESTEKIRATWNKIKILKFYYVQVGMLDTPEMIRELKRFYFGKVGRYDEKTHQPNQLIFSFDYIKPKRSKGMEEYQYIGDMIQSFKNAIQSDILDDNGNPVISMFTSVQANRQGIINNNKSLDEIQEDEGVVALSDRIIQYVSHMFLLRRKVAKELQFEIDLGVLNFGSHKLINLKPRSLGKMVKRAQTLVKFNDGSLHKNDIHLNIDNFNIEEMGDTVDLLNISKTGRSIVQKDDAEDRDLL